MRTNSVVHRIEKHSKSCSFWGDIVFTNLSKITFFEKVTTDFENRAKCLAEIKTCIFFFFTWTTRLYPREQVQSILQPQNSILFAHFRFEYNQLKKINSTVFMKKKHSFPKMLSNAFIDERMNWKLWNNRTSCFVYTAARRNALNHSGIFPLQAIEIIVLSRHELLIHSVDFISDLIATKISIAFEP